MQLSNQLRTAMSEIHDKIEELPLSKAIIAGTISTEDYCALLQQLSYVHQVFEGEMESCSQFAHLYQSETMARFAAIERDLEYFGNVESATPLGETLEFCQQIHQWASESPVSLLGLLYVLEGSRMGSMVLAKSLGKAFALKMDLHHGLDYHIEGIATRPQVWVKWKLQLDQQAFSSSEMEKIIEASIAGMNGLYHIYQALGRSLNKIESTQTFELANN